MKRKLSYLSLFVFWLIGQSLLAQQPYEAAIMPKIGDSIYSLVDNLPMYIDVGQPGSNRIWDFTSLQSPFVRKYTYKGKKDAGILSIQKSGISFQYLMRDESIHLTAILNADPLRIGRPIDFRSSPPLLEYKNPVNYQDASSEYSRFIGYLSWRRVPTQFHLSNYDMNDSLRIVLEVNRDDAVDAWGDLLMQNEAFEVVRMRRIEEQMLHVYARNNIGEWVEVSEELKSRLKGVAWTSISYSYLYLADGMAGPIAEVYTDEADQVQRVIYSADPKMAELISPNKKLRGVFVYPNPTLGDVRFEFFNLPNGDYELTIYNILGKKMWTAEEKIDSDKVILADLSFLRRGTYFYSLIDEVGKRIVTRRLIIIKP